MPTRFWQVPPSGLTAHSAILTARRTVCHTAPLRNVVPLLASPPPDTSPTAPKTTPPLCVRLFPYPLLPHRSRPQTLCSTPCPPASAPRRGRLRDPAPRPKSPLKKKPHRAPGRSHCRPHTPLPETGSFPHSPPRRPKRNDPKAAPQTQRKPPALLWRAPSSDAPRKAERRRENYFAIPFMIAPETPGAAWYSPNE